MSDSWKESETMSPLQHARSFRDLVVDQKARAVAKRLFEVTKRFPGDEMYSLTDQGRRSSRSVGAQIAEAWAKRRYEKHFVSKLTDADGEQQETQHWIETAADCGYLTAEEVRSLNSELAEIGRRLNSLIEKAASFCGETPSTLHESAVDYFTTTDD
jgi:four helix bundle protein